MLNVAKLIVDMLPHVEGVDPERWNVERTHYNEYKITNDFTVKTSTGDVIGTCRFYLNVEYVGRREGFLAPTDVKILADNRSQYLNRQYGVKAKLLEQYVDNLTLDDFSECDLNYYTK